MLRRKWLGLHGHVGLELLFQRGRRLVGRFEEVIDVDRLEVVRGQELRLRQADKRRS